MKVEEKMKLEEIPKHWQTPFLKKCDCGKTHLIRTQDFNDPEYDTYVHIECSCGDYVEFLIPVN